MMSLKKNAKDLWKAVVTLSAAGMMLASSCTSDGLQAAIAGIDAVAGSLDQTRGDLTLGEWLLGELDDL